MFRQPSSLGIPVRVKKSSSSASDPSPTGMWTLCVRSLMDPSNNPFDDGEDETRRFWLGAVQLFTFVLALMLLAEVAYL